MSVVHGASSDRSLSQDVRSAGPTWAPSLAWCWIGTPRRWYLIVVDAVSNGHIRTRASRQGRCRLGAYRPTPQSSRHHHR